MSTEIQSTGIKCRVPECPGRIVEETERKYLGDPMHRIIGPGGRNQLTVVTVLYCPYCGIQYHKLPKK